MPSNKLSGTAPEHEPEILFLPTVKTLCGSSLIDDVHKVKPESPARRLFLFPGYCLTSEHPGESSWTGMLSGVAVSSKTKKIRRKLLINLLGRLMDATPQQLSTELCRIRTEPFFLAPARMKQVPISINAIRIPESFDTKRNGHFRCVIRRTNALTESSEKTIGVTAGHHGEMAESSLQVLADSGTSVISDIDDTIKFSNVENRAELLANTFLREFEPIDGMSDVYQHLALQNAAFHYVTASPWQLQQPLQEFLDRFQYPRGSMHFRTFRLTDHFLKRLGLIHRRGKAAAVRRLLANCPRRKFILIGDSGERDAEIYARCFRDHPHIIKRVLIRLVSPDHRYKESIIRARINLPPNVFATFTNSQQLGDLLGQSIGNH